MHTLPRLARALQALLMVACLMSNGHSAGAAPGCEEALERAGANRGQIERAMDTAPSVLRGHMEWLIAHMPEADLRTATANDLIVHVQQAFDAWQGAPWREQVSEPMFRDAILPYACVDETRELWRERLRNVCLPIVGDRATLTSAATAINRDLWPAVKVQYSTKRRKANQSPSESIDSGLASCTGLSILLIDACRSVGIPARFVGVPLWMDGSGNHSWVEVWDGSAWRFTGAAEATGEALDQAWFAARAAEQRSDDPQHGIYAVTWNDAPLAFPMVWHEGGAQSRAYDVTDRYRAIGTTTPPGQSRVYVTIMRGDRRSADRVVLLDHQGRELCAGITKDERFDTNDHLTLLVPNGARIVARVNDGEATMETTATSDPTHLRFVLHERPPALSPQAEHVAPTSPSAPAAPGAVRDDAPEDPKKAAPRAKGGAAKGLTKDAAAKQRTVLWKAYETKAKRKATAELDAGVITAGGVTMPIWFTEYGTAPKEGHSLWISMHGGGGAPKEVNDQQWQNQKHLYELPGVGFAGGEGIYVAPRAPTDTWNLWHEGHIDALFAQLIRDMIVAHGVNPDRVYITGYSAGGDGTYQLAPRMSDWFAAAGMMAGHPNETKPDGLRNIAFTLHMGGNDAAYDRNAIARSWKEQLAQLHAKDPGGYEHWVDVHEGKPHWMDREDAKGIEWMAKHTRRTRPDRIVWLQDDVTHDRMYWLKVDAPKAGALLVAHRTGQVISIDEARDVSSVTVRLDDSMLDLDQPVIIKEGTTVLFEGTVDRRKKVLEATLAERGDPEGMYCAEVTVPLHSSVPQSTPSAAPHSVPSSIPEGEPAP